ALLDEWEMPGQANSFCPAGRPAVIPTHPRVIDVHDGMMMLGHTARTPVAAAATVAGTLLLAAGCACAPSGDQSPGSAAPATATDTAEPADATARATAESAVSSAVPPELTRVDPSAVSVPGSPGAYAWNYSV